VQARVVADAQAAEEEEAAVVEAALNTIRMLDASAARYQGEAKARELALARLAEEGRVKAERTKAKAEAIAALEARRLVPSSSRDGERASVSLNPFAHV